MQHFPSVFLNEERSELVVISTALPFGNNLFEEKEPQPNVRTPVSDCHRSTKDFLEDRFKNQGSANIMHLTDVWMTKENPKKRT